VLTSSPMRINQQVHRSGAPPSYQFSRPAHSSGEEITTMQYSTVPLISGEDHTHNYQTSTFVMIITILLLSVLELAVMGASSSDSSQHFRLPTQGVVFTGSVLSLFVGAVGFLVINRHYDVVLHRVFLVCSTLVTALLLVGLILMSLDIDSASNVPDIWNASLAVDVFLLMAWVITLIFFALHYTRLHRRRILQ